MNAPAAISASPIDCADCNRVPQWLKIAYTAFMSVLVPVYWHNYGPTNFLYFCDVALFLTLAAVWTGSPLLASMGAVGILLPQMLWVIDFAVHFLGFKLTGMTDYMFNHRIPLHARSLSLFHGWLPFLLLFLVRRLGYDRRALPAWTGLAWGLMLVSFFFLPAPGSLPADSRTPVNVDYVFGMSDAAPQTWMPAGAWLALLLVGLPVLVYMPTALLMRKMFKPAPAGGRA